MLSEESRRNRRRESVYMPKKEEGILRLQYKYSHQSKLNVHRHCLLFWRDIYAHSHSPGIDM